MEFLPQDILALIFKYFPLRDFSKIILVCKKWKEICKSEFIWKSFVSELGLMETSNLDSKTLVMNFKLSKYVILTGESSGDHYGSLLATELTKIGVETDVIDCSFSIPSQDNLLKYQAALIYSVDGSSFYNGERFGDLLYEYVIENGRGAVICVFSNCNNMDEGFIRGKFEEYLPQEPAGQTSLHMDNAKIHTIFASNHPTLKGVKDISYISPSICPGILNPNCKLIASWSLDTPMLIERVDVKGKVIGLNMFPVPASPLSEWEFNVWDVNTDGYILLASCLKYANPLSACYKWKS